MPFCAFRVFIDRLNARYSSGALCWGLQRVRSILFKSLDIFCVSSSSRSVIKKAMERRLAV